MILDHFSLDQCGWLRGDGPEDTIVLSSRVRLARNLAEVPFSNWADTATLERVRARVTEALNNIVKEQNAPQFEVLTVENMSQVDREFLAERNLISSEMVSSALPRSVAISEDETISIMINEEDHIRMQCIRPGRDLVGALNIINKIDDMLSDQLEFAFSPRWGYLTACPTNTGTGMRGSIMLHMPSLVWARQIEKVLQAVQRSGLAIRGLGGEGSEITGNLFQISNQITLGASEQQTVETVLEIVSKLVEAEGKATEELLNQARVAVEDNVWRAYGVLATARSISTDEVRRLLSSVRLGITAGLIDKISTRTVNEILLCSGPAHLQKLAGTELEQEERDQRRAEFVREKVQLN